MRSDLLGAAAAAVFGVGALLLTMTAVIARLAEGRRRSQRFLHRVSEAIDAHLYSGELRDGVYRETYTGPGFDRFAGPLPVRDCGRSRRGSRPSTPTTSSATSTPPPRTSCVWAPPWRSSTGCRCRPACAGSWSGSGRPSSRRQLGIEGIVVDVSTA